MLAITYQKDSRIYRDSQCFNILMLKGHNDKSYVVINVANKEQGKPTSGDIRASSSSSQWRVHIL